MVKSILVIDDDPDDLFFFVEAMADLSPHTIVHQATSGEWAIDFILSCRDQQYPEIIFLDINMPVDNGWLCLREIKKITKNIHVPIVMFSTSNFENENVKPSDIGAAAFLTKPDTMEGLKRKLSEVINLLAR